MSFQGNELQQWCAIVLACESGSSYSSSLTGDRANQYHDTPKSLLPIGGVPLLDHWLNSFSKAGIRNVVIIGNDQNFSKLLEWANTRGLPLSNVVRNSPLSGGSNSVFGLNQVLTDERLGISVQNLLFVSGSMLVHSDLELRDYLRDLQTSGGVLYDDFCSSTQESQKTSSTLCDSVIRKELMKGKHVISPAGKESTCVIAYAFRGAVVPSILEYFKVVEPSSGNELNDVQNMFNWMIQSKNMDVTVRKSDGIFSMQTSLGYEAAVSHYSASLSRKLSLLPPSVTRCCPARIGLMGNPSDGFKGKTLSFLISNFEATVTIRENPSDRSGEHCRAVTLIPHPVLDPSSFCDIAHLQLHTINKVRLCNLLSRSRCHINALL